MINIIELYNALNEQLSKDNFRGITGEEFTRSVNIIQDAYFRELIGRTNSKVDGRTRVSYGNNQDTDARLDAFRERRDIDVIDGIANLPSDAEKVSSMVNKSTRTALKRLDEDRIGSIFGNPLREPNEDDIYYLEGGKGVIEVFGIVDKITVRYLRLPKRAKLVMRPETITAGSRTVTRYVPDSGESINLEWGETEKKNILNRLIDMFSTPNRDVFLTQKTERSKVNE